jgi:hypothetical protein
MEIAAKIVGAAFVVALGKYLAYRMSAKKEPAGAA